MSDNLKPAYQKLLMQLNIIAKEYFLRELLDVSEEIYELATQGRLAVEKIEDLMKFWQQQVMLDAQKEAEMLFTDDQLSAKATLKKQVATLEKQLQDERLKLETIDEQRRQLERTLIDSAPEDIGSKLLAAACDEFWVALISQRQRNVDQRHQALIEFIEKMKTKTAPANRAPAGIENPAPAFAV